MNGNICQFLVHFKCFFPVFRQRHRKVTSSIVKIFLMVILWAIQIFNDVLWTKLNFCGWYLKETILCSMNFWQEIEGIWPTWYCIISWFANPAGISMLFHKSKFCLQYFAETIPQALHAYITWSVHKPLKFQVTKEIPPPCRVALWIIRPPTLYPLVPWWSNIAMCFRIITKEWLQGCCYTILSSQISNQFYRSSSYFETVAA